LEDHFKAVYNDYIAETVAVPRGARSRIFGHCRVGPVFVWICDGRTAAMEADMDFTFVQNVKIVYGIGALRKINELIAHTGYKKPLLVYDKGLEKSGITDKLKSYLTEDNIDFSSYDNVLPDPPAAIIDEAGYFCRSEGCDCIIAIGGGSTIDTAKGLNIVSRHGGSIMDYKSKPFGKCNGLISIPTTAGTGSELSQGIIVTDERNNRKAPILAFNSMSEYVILDPELAFGLPAGLTVFTGLDVFSHAAEAYTTINANTLTDIVCEKIMSTVVEYLPEAAAERLSEEAKERMCSAAAMGGWMLYNSSAHVGHSLAHVIGNTFNLPHGLVCAYTLPVMLRFIAKAEAKKVRHIGKILGCAFSGGESHEEAGRMAADAYTAFRDGLRGMKSIETYGLSRVIVRSQANTLAEKLNREVFNELSPCKIDMGVCECLIESFAEYLNA
jgi:alcohol dehydrogenase class IV